jgi:hypothetical protein
MKERYCHDPATLISSFRHFLVTIVDSACECATRRIRIDVACLDVRLLCNMIPCIHPAVRVYQQLNVNLCIASKQAVLSYPACLIHDVDYRLAVQYHYSQSREPGS